MIDDVRNIIEKGIYSLYDAFPEIRELADYEGWKKREDTNICKVARKGKNGRQKS